MENDEIKKYKDPHTNNRIGGGLILIAAGGLLLAKKLGADIPQWLFSWHMLLIAIGLLLGFKSNFKNAGALIMILVGCAFLINDIIPGTNIQNFIWPGILIIIGILIMIKPRMHFSNNRNWRKFGNTGIENNEPYQQTEDNFSLEDDSEFIEINAVFSGVKKIVLSKNFKGGEINAFMGGAEINLQQADIKQAAVLEVNNVFGGTKIFIPSNWDIKNEITAVFGGVEDKRSINLPAPDAGKSIILRGTCVFGGIEIKNF